VPLACKPESRAPPNPLLSLLSADVDAYGLLRFSIGPGSDDHIPGPVVQWLDTESRAEI
jgi:hypothetical protein